MTSALRSIDRRSAWLILVACMAVSMVVAAMASLNTALADIAIDIGADTGQMTWIVDGYTLALAALLLPAGAIGDRLGRREVLAVGLVLFAIASLLAIWTTTPTQLIATRCLAGAAAALIMPATLSLITSGVPEDKRSIGISVWAAVGGTGAIAGFIVTGVLLEFYSWHSIFITFAISAALTALLCLTIGSSKDPTPKRFDVAGSALSILAVTGIVFGLLEAPHRGWGDWLVVLMLVGGVLLGVAFCVVELKIPNHLLDIRLFTNRAFGAGSLSVALQFFASFGVFFLFLQRVQLVFGFSPLMSAFALGPMVFGIGTFALIGNWIAVRFDSLRLVLASGSFLAGIGVLCMGVVDYADYKSSIWMLTLTAIGLGLAMAPATTAIMSNTPLNDQGVGSAVNDTARELGAAIGIAIGGSVLAAGYASRIGPTADLARTQLTEAGQQRIAAGDTAGGQLLLAQADGVADHISRSMAEANEVVGRLPAEAAPLADQLRAGAEQAFTTPTNQACVIIAAVLIAGSLVLAWLSPQRIVALAPTSDPG